ncbi:hypothetical protein FOZ62_007763 [Perkinsus olseni]|uniref:WW domain-containing protein n=1 Tax=Perkinsus olseni TaxID=32597 RepID=A0A7J6Q113_PEROL|nr:hypothetical protein FOZ62_007763 [Perkinsus olseni]
MGLFGRVSKSRSPSKSIGESTNRPGGDAESVGGAGERRGSSDGAAGSSRGVTTVNDFVARSKMNQKQGLKPSGPELVAYAKYLGVDPMADGDLLWIAEEAILAPLPGEWTEHFDSNDRIFYYNSETRSSTWTHPLEGLYRDAYRALAVVRDSNTQPHRKLELIRTWQEEVTCLEREVGAHSSAGGVVRLTPYRGDAYQRELPYQFISVVQVQKALLDWGEHVDDAGNKFYANRETGKSTWTDPRTALCHSYQLKSKVLKMMCANAGVKYPPDAASLRPKEALPPMVASASAGPSSRSSRRQLRPSRSPREDHRQEVEGRASSERGAVEATSDGAAAADGSACPTGEALVGNDGSPDPRDVEETAEQTVVKKKKKKKKKHKKDHQHRASSVVAEEEVTSSRDKASAAAPGPPPRPGLGHLPPASNSGMLRDGPLAEIGAPNLLKAAVLRWLVMMLIVMPAVVVADEGAGCLINWKIAEFIVRDEQGNIARVDNDVDACLVLSGVTFLNIFAFYALFWFMIRTLMLSTHPGRAESLEELAQRRLEEVQAAVGKAEPDSFYFYDTFDPATIRRRPINKAPPAASTPSPPDAQDDPVAAHKRQKIDNEAFESRAKDEFLEVGESDGLGRGREQFKSDEEFIKSSILYLVGVWKHKSEETKWKGTIVGKTKAYLDTVDRMRPLVALLEHDEKAAPEDQHRVPPAVVDVLKGVLEEIMKREYVEANKLYLDMTVGNQLWPMGGINLGVVQQVCRRVEEKSHLLDDVEVKRYVQGIKRLITVAMTMWPNQDESKNFQP